MKTVRRAEQAHSRTGRTALMRKPPIPDNEEEIRSIVNQAIEEIEAMDFHCNRLVPLEMCDEDVFGCFMEDFDDDDEGIGLIEESDPMPADSKKETP